MIKQNNNPTDDEITRHHLQSVIDGHTTLYNTISEEYVKVTNTNIEGMIDLFAQLSKDNIDHLVFIHGEHTPIDLENIPIITGDSDTDELLDDERIAQLEGQAIDQMMNLARGK